MINSNQVNALMMQQQQQQQMLGMGAPQAVVGQSQYPPQFNFGANPLVGGRLSGAGGMGGLMASGVSGLGTALGVGSTAAMFGSMVGVGGASYGGLAGLALGNPLSAALMAGAAGVGAVGNAMNTGIQTNNTVGQMLSAANFANPNAPGGFGFSFGDQARMTRTVLGMGASNPFVNTQEQTQLLGSFQQMGLDRGVTSMGKMIEKFKEFSKTSEDVATQLGKTVTEVTGILQNLRGSGFYSADEVSGMTQRMSASASYGITMQQQQQMIQNMGSQARSMGLQRSTGGMLGVNLAQMFGAAGQTGAVNENAMLSLTGTTNIGDASTALAQQFGSRFGNTMAGGGVMEKLLAGFTKVDADGNLTIDERAMSGIASGGMDFDTLRSRTSAMAGGRNKAAFETNKRRLASEFLKSDQGMGAILGTFRSMASDRAQGGDMSEEEAFTLLMKQYQLADEEESKMLFDMSDNIDQLMAKNTENKINTLASEKRRAYLAKHRSFAGMKRKIGHELSKIYNNPLIAERTATGSTMFDAGISAIERDFFGLEDNKMGIFTDNAVNDFYDSFMAGDLNNIALGGGATDPFKRELANRVGDLSKYDEFSSFLSGSIGKAGQDRIGGIKLDTGSFEYHTDYNNRGFFSNNTANFFGGLTGKFSDTPIARLMAGKSVFAGDDERDLERLMEQAKDAGAKTDKEAYAAIAAQSPEAAAALQRYLGTKGDLAATSLVNLSQEEYMSMAVGKDAYGYGDVAGFGALSGGAGLLGAVASGAALGSTFAGVGAIGGAVIGLGYGIMRMGQEREYQAQLKGSAGNLLAKLSTKKKLRDFDKLYQKELLSNGGDKEAAKQAVAKKLSEELGEAVSSEDVGASIEALSRASGSSYKERLESDDYSKALKLTGAAGKFQKAEIAMGHVSELRDQLLGKDIEGIEGLQAALASSGDQVIGNTQEELLELVKKAATGEFTYEGDNEILKAVADTKNLTDNFAKLEGGDLSDIDAAFNQKGLGARLRKIAGVRKGGSLSEKELKKMAQIVAGQNVLALTTSDAKQGMAAATAGAGDDDVVKATTTLLNSSQKLAVYVDNIASVLTGNEVAGQKIPGLDDIDIRRNR